MCNFHCLPHRLESIGSAVLFSTKVTTWNRNKSPIWCFPVIWQISFPTSVHENSFLIARNINIVAIITWSQFSMDDALWCQHLLYQFIWLRHHSTWHVAVVSATGLHAQVRQLYCLSCLEDELLYLFLCQLKFLSFGEKTREPGVLTCRCALRRLSHTPDS